MCRFFFLWVASPRQGIVVPLLGPVALRFCVRNPKFGSRQSFFFDRGGSSKRLYTRTRTHESVFAILAEPSELHAALLVAGGLPGEPGSSTFGQPGPATYRIFCILRWSTRASAPASRPIVDDRTGGVFRATLCLPEADWLNGRAKPMLADDEGSVVGLATFGDNLPDIQRPGVHPRACLRVPAQLHLPHPERSGAALR